ncbi:E3 ubiquitin-protein ligase RNF126 isoform X1 [Salarias fasciatus]|uniref:RING-type E3 ubiquitin transferase n=1 Tax=Salarias fasciatus TaxID=181472 RepID=A0A672HRE7_SALFA|nr:E3 ubiquitin-protein ligase RNF126 isoform X1 [Salarias fasciatus]
MAEAPPWSSRFFCHRCSAEIRPRLPEYTCPRCDSGFIEELLEDRSADYGSMPTISSGPSNQQPFEHTADPHWYAFPTGYVPFTLGVFDDTFDVGATLGAEDNQEAENRRERDLASRQRYSARQLRSRHSSRQVGRHEGVPTLEGIIQQVMNGIIAPTAMPNIGVGPWGVLHSNPMDYAWGANGLDAIITQLLNQFENTGPPPADRDKIKSLPTVQITDDHVASGLECPVCKEDYIVGENVRQLPCNHMFHNECIVPWLEQHDTCPVCRKSLSGQNTATNPPELSGMNFTSSPSSSSSSSSSSSTPQP